MIFVFVGVVGIIFLSILSAVAGDLNKSIIPNLTAMIDALKEPIELLQGNLEKVDSVIQAILHHVNTVSNKVNFIVQNLGRPVNDIRDSIHGVVPPVVDGIKGGVNSVSHGINDGVNTASKAIGQTANSVINGVQQRVNAVSKSIHGIAAPVGDGIKSGVNSVDHGIRSGVNSAANAIGRTADSAFNGVQQAAHSVKGLLTGPINVIHGRRKRENSVDENIFGDTVALRSAIQQEMNSTSRNIRKKRTFDGNILRGKKSLGQDTKKIIQRKVDIKQMLREKPSLSVDGIRNKVDSVTQLSPTLKQLLFLWTRISPRLKNILRESQRLGRLSHYVYYLASFSFLIGSKYLFLSSRYAVLEKDFGPQGNLEPFSEELCTRRISKLLYGTKIFKNPKMRESIQM